VDSIPLLSVVVLGFLFALINGFHDGGNVIATVVSSRSLPPARALLYACVAEFLGPLSLGTAVAVTVGMEIFDPLLVTSGDAERLGMLLSSALISAIVWDLFTWWVGMPTSSSHALVGGMVGAGIATSGTRIIIWDTLVLKAVLPLLITPIIGIGAGYAAMRIAVFLFRNAHPRINLMFKRVQAVTSVFLAGSHGANDAQKSMGLIAMMLFGCDSLISFEVPGWVAIGCAGAMALGVSLGGWRIIRTMGTGIFKVQALHSFNAQLTAGSVIFASGFIGLPVSTTQIVGSTIMGVGAGDRFREVRWVVAKDVLVAWLTTIPASAMLGAFTYLLVASLCKMDGRSLELIIESLGSSF